jgi:2-iminobutanoate/2-iminopropanoate deaminase
MRVCRRSRHAAGRPCAPVYADAAQRAGPVVTGGIIPIGGLAPTVGLYSQAVPLPEGTTPLFVAGQLSVDADGNALGVGDFEGQMRAVFANLEAVVMGSGGRLDGIMKMTTYLVDPEHIVRFYDERERLFKDLFPEGVYPGNTLLVVQRLVRPEFLIEVEAIVAIRPTEVSEDA